MPEGLLFKFKLMIYLLLISVVFILINKILGYLLRIVYNDFLNWKLGILKKVFHMFVIGVVFSVWPQLRIITQISSHWKLFS